MQMLEHAKNQRISMPPNSMPRCPFAPKEIIYLHSDPFWWAALKEVFTVDNEELFEKQVPFARERVEWSSNAPKIHVVDTQSRNQNEER